MSNAPFHRDPRNLVIIVLGISTVSLGGMLMLRQAPPPPPSPTTATPALAVDPSLQPVQDAKSGRTGKSPYETNQVRNTITKNTAAIRDCYVKFTDTKPAITGGKVLVDWQIKGDGSVLSADIVSSDLQSEMLHQCITGSIKTWKFPPPPTDRTVYTTFTFVFADAKDAPPENPAPTSNEGKPTP